MQSEKDLDGLIKLSFFADIGKAMGGWAERITNPEEIRHAIGRARKATDSGRAALLEFVTSEEHAVSHLHEL